MTPAMLAGDFTVIASTTCQKTAIVLSDPAGDWVGNKIAPSLMDPIALKIAKLLPQGNPDQLAAAFSTILPAQTSVSLSDPRSRSTTRSRSQKQSAFVRYQLSNNYTPFFFDATDPLFTGGTVESGQQHPGHGHRAHLHHQRQPLSAVLISPANRSLNPRFTPPFQTPAAFEDSHHRLCSGFSEYDRHWAALISGRNPGYFNTLDYSGSEDLTLIKGKHQIAFGASYIRAYMHAQNVRGVNGNLNFTGQYSNAAGTTGLGYSDFVTGQLNAFGQGLAVL